MTAVIGYDIGSSFGSRFKLLLPAGSECTNSGPMSSRPANLRYEFLSALLGQLPLCILLVGVIVRVHDQLELAASHSPCLGFYSTLDEVAYPITFT